MFFQKSAMFFQKSADVLLLARLSAVCAPSLFLSACLTPFLPPRCQQSIGSWVGSSVVHLGEWFPVCMVMGFCKCWG
jgi:hypothetical protein